LGEYKKGPFGSSLTKSMFVPFSQSAIKIYEQKNAIKKDYSLGDYYISKEKFKDMSAFQVLPSDIIVSCAGTIGETYILPKEAPIGIINQALMKVALFEYKISEFWRTFFEYILVKDSTMKGAGSAIKNIPPFEYLKKILTPLPPLKEQQRIVEKIEELIPHIEHYSKAQTELDTLNKNIKEQLKKSVLQYAIEGKLVPQDETEGTAEVLLEQIQKEKQKLYEENKLKKKDLEHSIIFKAEDNKYYEKIGKNVTEIESDYSFPNSWAITRLSSICILTDGEKKEGQNICLDAKFLRGKTEGDYLQKGRFVEKGDNIILVDGENSGEVFTIPRNGYMGSTFKKLWVNPVMDLQYVLYFIQFYKDLLRNSKKGAAIPHLNKELFYSLLIGIPPLSEQQRIVNTIQNIFRCIEKN